MLTQTFLSNASEYPNLSWKLLDEWIHVEAPVDVFCDLNRAGSISVTSLEDARVKTSEARLTCDYDPSTPQPTSEEDEDQGVDWLADGAWFDSTYVQGENGEGVKGRDGDGHYALF